ncbi:unnamed protein product [Parajaminaea phylloscopi]
MSSSHHHTNEGVASHQPEVQQRTGAAATHGAQESNKDSSLPSIPGDARIDPEVPKSAKEAPLFGVEAAKDTPFKEAVQGHARYFAGKVFGNDKEVQQGAARLRGEEDTLPDDIKPTSSSSSNNKN